MVIETPHLHVNSCAPKQKQVYNPVGPSESNLKPPKRNKSAFIHFNIEIRKKLKMQDPKANSNDIVTKISSIWHGLSPNERSIFEERAKKDQERYYKELSVYQAASGGKSSSNRTRKNHIKKPCTFYGLFVKDNTETIRNQNPQLKMSEVLKIISTMWKMLDEESKDKYRERAKEEKAAFEAENQGYQRTYRKHQDKEFVNDKIVKEKVKKLKKDKKEKKERKRSEESTGDENNEMIIKFISREDEQETVGEHSSEGGSGNSGTLETLLSPSEFLVSRNDIQGIEFNMSFHDFKFVEGEIGESHKNPNVDEYSIEVPSALKELLNL